MRACFAFFKMQFIKGLQYRAAAWAGVFTQFFWGFMEMQLYRALYADHTAAFPMRLTALGNYIWLRQALFAMLNTWSAENELFDSVLSGNIAYELCRPVGIYGMWFSRTAALRTSRAALRCLPILVFSFLLPDDATDNEKLFGQALSKIEGNIANCITSDALALANKDETAVAESNDRWQVVDNSITLLQSAKSASELTAIINGEKIDVKQAEPDATPTPTPAPNYNTLSKGDKSNEVLEMQNRLWELGFLLDDRDGNFGSKTQTAVKMFQQQAGLPITGIADGETLARLYADDAPRTAMAQATVQVSTTAIAPETTDAPTAAE